MAERDILRIWTLNSTEVIVTTDGIIWSRNGGVTRILVDQISGVEYDENIGVPSSVSRYHCDIVRQNGMRERFTFGIEKQAKRMIEAVRESLGF